MQRKTRDHFIGCLLGGALGDAIGSEIEFLSRDEIHQAYGPLGIQELVADGFTDDTQLTLFTAEGLIRACLLEFHSRTDLLAKLHRSYLRWLHTQGEEIAPELRKGWLLTQQGLFEQRAPGVTCLEALGSGSMGQREHPLNDSKGCGGIMRVAPIGLFFHEDPEKAFFLGADAAAITHGHPSGYLSAGYFAALIALLVQGQALPEAISHALPMLEHHAGHEECRAQIESALDLYAAGMEPTSARLEQMGGKWPGVLAEEALGMSLFCALSHQGAYRAGVLAAVNHSGDSDCVGSLTGQLLGLINCFEALPPKWISQLQLADVVETMAGDLFSILTEPENHEVRARQL